VKRCRLTFACNSQPHRLVLCYVFFVVLRQPAPFLEEALIVHGRRRRKKVNYAEVDESDEEAYYAEDPDSDAESTPRSSRGRSKDGKKRKHKKKKKKKKKSRSYNSSSSEPEVML